MASASNNFVDDHDIYHPSELRKRQNPNKTIDHAKYYEYATARDRESAFVILIQFAFMILLISMAWKFSCFYYS